MAQAEALVQRVLVKPLAAKEAKRGRFSRAMQPPTARRVRVTDTVAQADAKGQAFLRFAVDARYGFELDGEHAPWKEAVLTGCAYPTTGAVFVASGDRHRPAELLLGKSVGPAEAHVCVAAPDEVAQAR